MRSIGSIFVNLPAWRDLWIAGRSNLEWIATGLCGATMLNWRVEIAQRFASKEWDAGAFCAAVFDWSSIQAAFLFGIYAFFLSRSEPFIQAIAGSPAFKSLRRYVVRTLYLSMMLTIASLPFLIATPVVQADAGGFGFFIMWILSVLFIFTFFSFLKVIRVFGKIERRS